jgi:hypothetical protein
MKKRKLTLKKIQKLIQQKTEYEKIQENIKNKKTWGDSIKSISTKIKSDINNNIIKVTSPSVVQQMVLRLFKTLNM